MRGVPALRQDWSWFSGTLSLLPALANATSIWDPSGIGGFNPLVTAYPFYVIIGILAHVVGGEASFIITVAAVSAGALLCGGRIATACGADQPWIATLTGLFVLLNPWVYTEIVAGHLVMVIAYLGLAALFGEFASDRPSKVIVLLATLAAGLQLQLLLLSAPLVALLAYRSRTWKPPILWVLLAAPEAVTVVAGYADLRRTPFTLPWEAGQSVSLAHALTLTGYFAGYTVAYTGVFLAAAWGIFAVALFGATSSRLMWQRIVVVVVGLAAVAWASAPQTLLAPLFDVAYRHITALGVFRELYDLLALSASALAVCCALAMLRSKTVSGMFGVAVAVMALYWGLHPPSAFWVGKGELPVTHVNAPPNSRFLLLPAIQPLTYHGAGLGMDPDRAAHDNNVTPLNVFYAEYPALPAIAAYMQRGDVSGVAALSTSTVIYRSGYATDLNTLRGQLGGTAPRLVIGPHAPQPRSFMPELSVLLRTGYCSLCNRIGAGNVLITDDPGSGAWAVGMRGDRRFADIHEGWVDAQLIFVSRPDLAQAFGGAATTNSSARLPLPARAPQVLAYVEGALRDDSGRALPGGVRNYAWLNVPSGAKYLQCRGFCVVAAAGQIPDNVPVNGDAQHYRGLNFSATTPWLLTADAGNMQGVLRYNAAWNQYWIAYVGGRPLPHIRLDGAVNGWRIPAGASGRILIIQSAAALAACLEVLGLVLGALLLYSGIREVVGVPGIRQSGANVPMDAAG